MSGVKDRVIERARVREVAGVFRSRDELDAAVETLLMSGFDRADIDLAARQAAHETLGLDIPAEELPEVPGLPRQPVTGREDIVIPAAMGIGILAFIGAAAGAAGVVASGGGTAIAVLAALAGGAVAAAIGVWIARRLRRQQPPELDQPGAADEMIILVRLRSPERESKAQRILATHGAAAVRVHEIEIEKRLEDLPLSSLRVDPWLGDEPLRRP